MRFPRVFAFLLALASVGFVAFCVLQQAIDFRSLVLVVAGAGMLLVMAAVTGFRRLRRGWLLALAALAYSVLVLGALVLQLDQERMLSVRAALSGMLLAGLLLMLWSAFVTNRPKRRDGLHNYFDH